MEDLQVRNVDGRTHLPCERVGQYPRVPKRPAKQVMDKHDRNSSLYTVDGVAGGRTRDIAFVTTFQYRLAARRLLVPEEAFKAAVGRHSDSITEYAKGSNGVEQVSGNSKRTIFVELD